MFFFVHEDFWPLNTSLFIKEYKNATPSFAYFFLQQVDTSAFNGGSAVPTLNRNHIHSLAAIIPKYEVIQQFDQLVMPLFKRQRQNQIQINTLSELRDILLPQLISGKLRIEDDTP
jgi:type I restriction enzyme, S subunit